ncbi:MAG: hypothetical protein CL940_12340 [Deltaproteobacteria bacterium]|nr:hypothetical protein [Deltaproteobacteria bacterium]
MVTPVSSTPPEAPPRRGRIPRWLWWMSIFLVAMVLLASIASTLVRNRVDARLASLGERLGLDVELGSLSLSLGDGILLQDLTAAAREGSPTLQIHVEEIAVQVEPSRLFSSSPRPDRLRVRGVRGHLDASPPALKGWRDRAAGPKAPPRATAVKASPIGLSLKDVQITLHGPGERRDGVIIRGVEATGELGGSRGHLLEGQAELAIGPASRRMTFTGALGEVALVELDLDKPLGVELDAAGARVGLSTSSLSWTTEDELLSLENARMTYGARALGCEELEIQGLAPFTTVLDRMNRVSCKRVAISDKGRSINASELRLELKKPTPDVIVGGLLTIKDIGLGDEREEFEARARTITVRLVGDVIENARRGKLKGTVDSILITEPTMRLTLPEDSLDQALGAAPSAPSAPTGAIEEAAPDLRADAPPSPPSETEERPKKSPANVVVAQPIRVPLGAELVQHILDIGVTVQDGHMDLIVRPTEPPLRIDDLELELSEPKEPGKKGLEVSVSGLLHRAQSDAGRIAVTAHIAPNGALATARGEISGTDFANIISRFSDLVTVEPDSWVKLRFDYAFDDALNGAHRAKGSLELRAFGFQSWRVSHQPIKGLQGRFEYEADYVPSQHQLSVKLPRIEMGEMRLVGEARISRPPDDGASYDLRLSMPRQDCGAAARSIPPALVPRLEGWTLEGDMSFQARFTLDMDFIYGLTLDVDGDLKDCEALSLGDHVNVNELARYEWTHYPIEPERGRLDDVPVGPATPHWTSSSQIPLFVKAGAIVTEDRGFASHKGVRWDLIAKALRLDLHKERFVYGGSTITQQLVKNLFLTREKTLSRKLEELVISWQMERHFSKEELLTFYLNVIEYGPDLYGIRRAAAFYFGKAPAHLTPAEGAFLMGLKPYPRAGYRQWERQKLNSWWVGRVKSVLRRMHSLQGAISAADVQAAAPYQVRFRRPGESLMSGRDRGPWRPQPSVEP